VEKNGMDMHVASLSEGDCFGEMSLLTGENRSATVLAHTDCEVVEIRKPVLARSLKENPDLLAKLSELLAKRRLETEGVIAANTHPEIVETKHAEYTNKFVDKLRVFFNHPGFLEATEDRLKDALAQIPANAQPNVQFVYVAHSIPMSMANTSDYVKQLEEVRRLASQAVGVSNHVLVYQSRSGAPGQPWLEPDILDQLHEVKEKNLASAVVVAPISFISDHMEVLYDLDIEARQLCEELALPMARAKTVGVHPKFIAMIRELILERTEGAERRALGSLGPRQDVCAEDCCPAPQRPVRPQALQR